MLVLSPCQADVTASSRTLCYPTATLPLPHGTDRLAGPRPPAVSPPRAGTVSSPHGLLDSWHKLQLTGSIRTLSGNEEVFLRGAAAAGTSASCLEKTQKRNETEIRLTDP